MIMSVSNRTMLAAMVGAVLATSMVAPASARQPAGAHPDRNENSPGAQDKHAKDKPGKHGKQKAGTQKPHEHAHENARRDASEPHQAHRVKQQHESDEHRRDDGQRIAELRHKQMEHALKDARKQDKHEKHEKQDIRRISEQDQRARIAQQRSWAHADQQYRKRMHELEHERAQQLQQANRNAQYRYQQAYYQRLLAQQARVNNQRYDYNSNPYFYSPDTYRYSFGGRNYTTNQYGADLLRQAVNYGYQEGLRAGHADRTDRSNSDYRNSYAYQDASYGYDNYYVDRPEYNHYFREGFQRGYNDGYGSRSQYGNYSSNYPGSYSSNGTASILQTVLTTILNMQQMNR